MKTLIPVSTLMLLFIALGFVASAQSGIDFSQHSLGHAKKQAKAEDKLIFVDVYTDWCGPCKRMDKEVFTDSKVADFFNENFINVKANAEKKGKYYANRYGVRAYPTLLFLNHEGEVVKSISGGHSARGFYRLGEEALTLKNTNYSKYQTIYSKGNRKPEFLKAFAEYSYSIKHKETYALALEYLETQKDWSSVINMKFILKHSIPYEGEKLF